MAVNTANVSTGKPKITGAVSPRCRSAPRCRTDASTELAEGYKSLGYVSDDGMKNANSMEVENLKAWGGDIVLTTQTDREDTFQCKLIEALNLEVLKAVYGDDNGNRHAGNRRDGQSKYRAAGPYIWVST